MFKNISEKFIQLFFKSSAIGRFITLLIFFVIIIPILIFGYLNYNILKKHLTNLTLSRSKHLAIMSATSLQEKFDYIINLGVFFSNKEEFKKLIQSGKWDEAVKLFDNVPKDYSYIDNVVIFNPEGTIMAISPSIPEVVGINYAYRDYYKGVSKEWKPYVSGVFKRSAAPSYNIVSVAIPITLDRIQKSEKNILGILLFTIKLDSVLDWIRDIEVDSGSFIYFVDRDGNVAGHPKLSSLDDVVNFSEISIVKKVLNGESGVENLYNQIEKEENLSAYQPVEKYGWGAIVQQSATNAFSFREKNLSNLIITYSIILFFTSILGYFILVFIRTLSLLSQREKVFLNSIGDGVFAIDRYWNITLWNKAANNLTGWNAEEAIGRPFKEIVKFINVSSKKENISFIEEAMLHGKVRSMENHTILIRKDGTEVQVGDSASPIFDRSGQVIGCIIVFRDMSKEIQLEKIKEDFTYRIVHDLRSPITVISSILSEQNTAKLFSLNKDTKEVYDLLNSATKQMLKMINDLLTSAKSKTLGTSSKKISLSEVINETMKNLKPLAQTKKITYEYSPESNLPLVTVSSSDHLYEIFSNLFTNAIKYNKEKGRIIVTHEIADNFLKTNIKDDGIGIAEKDKEKLFSSYSRINEREGVQGTGLGLYIVKKLVEEANGKIEFSSSVGQGTTFSVYLPI